MEVSRKGLYHLLHIAGILLYREGLLVYVNDALDVEGLRLGSGFRQFRLGELWPGLEDVALACSLVAGV